MYNFAAVPAHSGHSVPKPWEQLGRLGNQTFISLILRPQLNAFLAPDPLDDKTATASLSGESLDTGLAAGALNVNLETFPHVYCVIGVLVDSLTTTGSSNEHQINPSIGDIKIEYHPHSKRPSDHIPLNEYRACK
jgi:hypothetical protein